MNPSSLRVMWIFVFIITLGLSACGAAQPIQRIGLLAPFEGRFREVGYNALYAARLALSEKGDTSIELLAVDDGGSAASASDRARALAEDPEIRVVVLLGVCAADAEVQRALGDTPALVVGFWSDTMPASDAVFVLSNPALNDFITAPAEMSVTEVTALDGPIVGGDWLALEQVALLRTPAAKMTIVSSASLPDATFIQRYEQSDPFAPEPGLLATLTYDTFGMIAEALQSGGHMADTLASITFNGLNGRIQFQNGYWLNAPIHTYGYDDSGQLVPVQGAIE